MRTIVIILLLAILACVASWFFVSRTNDNIDEAVSNSPNNEPPDSKTAALSELEKTTPFARKVSENTGGPVHKPDKSQPAEEDAEGIHKNADEKITPEADKSAVSQKEIDDANRRLRWSNEPLPKPWPCDLNGLLSLLGHENPNVRRQAVYSLGNLSDKRAVPALINMLRDEDENVRGWVIDALVKLKDVSAVPALIDMMHNDKDGNIRSAAAGALGKLGDKSAIPALIAALDDKERRNSAIISLGQLGDDSALIDFLGDKNASTRNCAVIALGLMKSKTAVPVLIDMLKNEPYYWTKQEIIKSLGNIGDKMAMPTLLAMLKTTKDKSIIEAIGKLKDPAAISQLVEIINNPDDCGYHYSAIAALAEIGDQSAVFILADIAIDDNNCLRRSAIIALGKLGYKSAVPALSTVVKGIDVNDRTWTGITKDFDANEALRSLFNIEGKEAEAAIVDALDSPSLEVRQTAALLLADRGKKVCLPVLIESLKCEGKDESARFYNRMKLSSRLKKLRELTGENFGANPAKWREWWDANKGRILKEEAEKDKVLKGEK